MDTRWLNGTIIEDSGLSGNISNWHKNIMHLTSYDKPVFTKDLFKILLNIYHCFWPGGTLIKFFRTKQYYTIKDAKKSRTETGVTISSFFRSRYQVTRRLSGEIPKIAAISL